MTYLSKFKTVFADTGFYRLFVISPSSSPSPGHTLCHFSSHLLPRQRERNSIQDIFIIGYKQEETIHYLALKADET